MGAGRTPWPDRSPQASALCPERRAARLVSAPGTSFETAMTSKMSHEGGAQSGPRKTSDPALMSWPPVAACSPHRDRSVSGCGNGFCSLTSHIRLCEVPPRTPITTPCASWPLWPRAPRTQSGLCPAASTPRAALFYSGSCKVMPSKTADHALRQLAPCGRAPGVVCV